QRWSQKSHLVLHGSTRMGVALRTSFRQAPHVRCALGFGLLLALVASASADVKGPKQKPVPPRPPAYPQAGSFRTVVASPPVKPSSNPAFLGIKMLDRGGGCFVEGVTPGS